MDKLKNISYRGETEYFSFEHYHKTHVKAYKQLLDIGYNKGKGLDDETKIFYFKAGIQLQADLETALTLAWSKENGTFADYVTYLSMEVDSKNRRKKIISSGQTRRVSSMKKNAKRNDILYEFVDWKRVESKCYSRQEYRKLTEKQKRAIKRLNSERRKRLSQTKTSKRTAAINTDKESSVTFSETDFVSFGEGIVSAIEKGSNEPPDDTVTEITNESTTLSKRKAIAGQVGSLFSSARRRYGK